MNTVVVVGGGRPLTHTTATSYRVTRGYAKSRQDYDRRRRRHPLDDEGRAYKQIVLADPCCYCGAKGVHGREQTAADHIQPLSLGGDNVWENLTASCRGCNASKRERPLLEWLREHPLS